MAADCPPDESSSRVSLRVPLEQAGVRLDRFLAEGAAASAEAALRGMSRSRLQVLIAAGRISIDGQPAEKSSLRLKGGEQVEITVPPPAPVGIAAEPMPLEVLYEDADLIAIAKPAGLAVHPGAGRVTGTLVNGLLAHCRDLSGIGGALRPGIVHRLDRGTSGVLVVAKHDRAHLGLARQFAAREVVKRYIAFVLGTPRLRTRTIDTLYGRHPTARKRFTAKLKAGKRAVTTYTVVASGGGLARLDVLLGTGRTHQIRVHLSESGHPVVGDATYGGRQFSRIGDAEVRAAAEALEHQALHAAVLEVTHPVSGVPLRFSAPLPPALEQLWEAMQQAPSE